MTTRRRISLAFSRCSNCWIAGANDHCRFVSRAGLLAPQRANRLSAFLGLFYHCSIAVGFCNWNPAAIATPMALYALVLEIAQNIVPGRHPALMDLAEGTFGAVGGVFVARFILSLIPIPHQSDLTMLGNDVMDLIAGLRSM
jgi:hypothetical protein